MKVIGLIDKDDHSSSKVIVEATKKELENIRGECSYSTGYCGKSKEIKVGSIINVSDIYHEATKTLNFYENFKSLVTNFRQKSEFLEKLLKTKKEE